MKAYTKDIFQCEMCETEYESEKDAMFCEQACVLFDIIPEKCDPDKMSHSEKERLIKELAIVFRKLWDKDGTHRKFYAQLSSE